MKKILPLKTIQYLWDDQKFYTSVVNLNKSQVIRFPKYEQILENDNLILNFALAGYSKKDIEVSISKIENSITISGKGSDRPIPLEDEIENGLARRHFKTAFIIHPDYSVELLKASMMDGLLTLLIPGATRDCRIITFEELG